MTAPNRESRYCKIIRQFKTYIITEELEKNNWNICRTAVAFGMHRNSLSRHMAELGIKRDDTTGHKGTNGKSATGAGAIALDVKPDGQSSRSREESSDSRVDAGAYDDARRTGEDVKV